MTNRERLEKIKKQVNYKEWFEGYHLDVDDIEWLIKQVEELEIQLSINTNNMKQLQKENERYKQALEKIRGLYPLRNVGYQVSEIRKIVIKALEG